jgi:hypothetical protein
MTGIREDGFVQGTFDDVEAEAVVDSQSNCIAVILCDVVGRILDKTDIGTILSIP